ncbi:hypothetical protein Pint_18988 [Pistacia integerrima]|uniref:Uncharacterized protein n=1 Tax=Pistacia integerrima TaxID=434235 RepID=A0ACC0YVM6_9ROSI|nr:hypothetical protein Pint_18988 [Pistacia integerrima]
MVVVRGVLYLSAQRVLGDGQTFVSVTVGARDASLKGLARVHKVALTSVRHMVEGKDAPGVILVQNMDPKLLVRVTHLQGGRHVFVHFTVAWCRIRGYMVVPL